MTATPDLVLGVIGALGILLGLVGTVVPVLPGLLVVLLATAGTLLAQGTGPVAWLVVAALVVLAVGGTVAGAMLPARTAARTGAPRRSLLMAAAGAVVGFVVLPVAGLLVGGLAGLALAERSRLGAWEPAVTSTRQVLGAYGLGILLELGVGVVMGMLWLVTFVVRA